MRHTLPFRPRLAGPDRAIARRIHLVEWNADFSEKQNENLRDELKSEWSRILKWIIDGAVAWRETGLNPPSSVLDSTQTYVEDEDTMGRWFDECVEEKQANTRLPPRLRSHVKIGTKTKASQKHHRRKRSAGGWPNKAMNEARKGWMASHAGFGIGYTSHGDSTNIPQTHPIPPLTNCASTM